MSGVQASWSQLSVYVNPKLQVAHSRSVEVVIFAVTYLPTTQIDAVVHTYLVLKLEYSPSSQAEQIRVVVAVAGAVASKPTAHSSIGPHYQEHRVHTRRQKADKRGGGIPGITQVHEGNIHTTGSSPLTFDSQPQSRDLGTRARSPKANRTRASSHIGLLRNGCVTIQ